MEKDKDRKISLIAIFIIVIAIIAFAVYEKVSGGGPASQIASSASQTVSEDP